MEKELLRQIANLIQEGQISLAAIHAFNNRVEVDSLNGLSTFVHDDTINELKQLVGELNVGTDG